MEKLIEDLLKTLREAVVNCRERSENQSLSAESRKYWEGATNAYSHVITATEREYNATKEAMALAMQQEELKQNWRGSK